MGVTRVGLPAPVHEGLKIETFRLKDEGDELNSDSNETILYFITK